MKVTSCDKQTVNQYRNIAPQHRKVPIKRRSSLTVMFESKITSVRIISVLFYRRVILKVRKELSKRIGSGENEFEPCPQIKLLAPFGVFFQKFR